MAALAEAGSERNERSQIALGAPTLKPDAHGHALLRGSPAPSPSFMVQPRESVSAYVQIANPWLIVNVGGVPSVHP